MFGSLGLPELLLIAFIIVLLFGANKIPEVFKGLGKGIKSFKEEMKKDEADKKEEKENKKIQD